MRIKSKTANVFVSADTSLVEERARTREEPSESGIAGLAKKLKSKLPSKLPGPTRISLSVPTMFQGLSKTTGSAKPNVRGAKPPQVPISDKKLPTRQLDKINAKASLAFDKMQTVHHASKQMQLAPATASAMSNLADFHREVAAMFGGGPEAQGLAQDILRLVPPASGDAQPATRPLKAPLMLATALHAVSLSDTPLAQARQLLQELRDGVHTPEAFSLQRVLASTAPGSDALCTALGIRDARKEPFCDALRVCSALEKKGVDVKDLSSPEQVQLALARDNKMGLDGPIGGKDDPPLRLLGKALRYANTAANLDPADAEMTRFKAPLQALDKPAYVAWKKGGFTESGKGSDFNKAIGRLHKFSTYVDRADHGPRTFRNMVKEMGTLVLNMVGVRKSPLTMTRTGMSGSLGTMVHEGARFKQALNDTLSPIRHHYHRQLSAPNVVADPTRFHAALARTAALDVWAGKDGRVNVPIAASDVAARAAQLHGALTGVPPLDPEQVEKQLKNFATSHQRNQGELSVQFRLKTLAKAVKQEQVNEAPDTGPAALAELRAESRALRSMPARTADQNARLDAVQAQLLRHTHAAVREARMIKSAVAPSKDLFKFKDLYRQLTSAPPREGPTAADVHENFRSISGGKLESMTRMEAGRTLGVGVDPAAVLRAVMMVKGVPLKPLVLPAIGHTGTSSAVVEVGDSLTGGRFYVGKQNNTSTFGQFGVGGVLPLPKGGGVAVPLALLFGAHNSVEGEGACITTRNDLPGWEKKSTEVVDFMFDQAIPPPGQQRPQSPAEFWQRFSDKFGDDPNVMMSMVKNEAQVGSASGIFGAAVRVPVGSDVTVGPTALASVNHTKVSSQLNTDAVAADVPTSFEGTTTSLSASLSIAQANPMAPLPSGDVMGLGTVVPYGNLRIDKNIDGQFAAVRIGRNADGTIAPFDSQRVLGFRSPDDMIAYVQTNMNKWVDAIRDQDPRNSDPNNTDHANKQTTEGARAVLHSYLQQIKDAPARGDVNFGEFCTLEPVVAERISDYEARLETLQGKGDGDASRRALSEPAKREINQLQNEIHRLLSDYDSWRPTALYGVENVGRSESTGGIDLVAKVGGSRSISAARLTSLLIAPLPDAAPAPAVPL